MNNNNDIKINFFDLIKKRPFEKTLYIFFIIIDAILGQITGELPAFEIILLSIGFIVGHVLAEPLWEYEKKEWPIRLYPKKIRKMLNKHPGIVARITSWLILLIFTCYFVLNYIAYL